MLDFKLTKGGDLEISEDGDISTTDSVCQAVRVRLLWFFCEWRLGRDMGFPYFEEVFVKNPSEAKIRHLIRSTVMSVEEVEDVTEIKFRIDHRTRAAFIDVKFTTDEDTFREEVEIKWIDTDLPKTE